MVRRVLRLTIETYKANILGSSLINNIGNIGWNYKALLLYYKYIVP
jgi:hypothetical protein